MVAAEAKRPRIYIKNAFKTVYWRFGIFFVAGALCVGIVIPYNDPTLVGILGGSSNGAGTAAASPYVIAMSNLGVEVLPSITNALMVTSIFSAGNVRNPSDIYPISTPLPLSHLSDAPGI
jgi:amino acid transporter